MTRQYLPGDVTLSPTQIARYALDAGFTPTPDTSAPMAVSVALRESGGHTRVVWTNSDSYHSRDRGVWQLNDHWHPEVDDATAFDPARAARETFRISGGGRDWHPWATSNDAGNTANLDAARAAVAATMAAAGGTTQPAGTTSQAPADPCGPYNHDQLGYELVRAGAADDAVMVGVAAAAKLAGAIPDPNGGYSGGSLYLCGNSKPPGETLWGLTPDQVNAAGGTVASLKTLAGHAAVFVRLWKDSGGPAFLPPDLRGPFPTDAAFLAKLRRPGFNPYTGTGYDAGEAVEGIGPVNPFEALAKAGVAVLSALGVLFNPELWKRAGLVIGGAVLVFGAGWLLLDSGGAGAVVRAVT